MPFSLFCICLYEGSHNLRYICVFLILYVLSLYFKRQCNPNCLYMYLLYFQFCISWYKCNAILSVLWHGSKLGDVTNHHLASGFIDTVYRQPILHGRPIDGPLPHKQFESKQWKSGEGQEPLGESSCPMRLYKEYKRQAFPICFTLSRFFYGFYYVQTFPFPPMSKKNCYQGESTWHIFVDKVSWSSLVL